MKTCSTCHESKIEGEYAKNKSNKDGLGYSCKVCHRKYLKSHYERNKVFYKDKAKKRQRDFRERTDALKSVPCTDCGGEWPPCAMDFDHLGGKVDTISNMVQNSPSWKKIESEIAKCEVVCAACHRVRTVRRLEDKLSLC